MKIWKLIIFPFLAIFLGCGRPDGVTLQGYIEGEYTELSSNYPGKLERLYVERGQKVAMDQLLFQLDPEPEQSQLQQAQNNLQSQVAKLRDYTTGQRATIIGGIIAQREQAQADLELAKANYNRYAQLFKKGVVSRQDYDQSLATLKANQQKVNQFEQNLQEAELGQRKNQILEQFHIVSANQATVAEVKWRLAQKTVRAPEAGLIFDTFFNEGEDITANQPVVSLLAPRYVWLIFYIPEPLRAKLRLNKKITFTCDNCQGNFVGYINYISPQAEYTPPVIFSRDSRPKLVYRVQAKLAPGVAEKIYPGQPVDVLVPNGSDRKSKNLRYWLWKLKSSL